MEEGIVPTQPQRSSKTIWSSGFECGDHFIRIYWRDYVRSLSLVSDAFHNLSDTLAIIFSYGAQKWPEKKQIKTYVWLPAFRNIECFHQLIHIDHIILVFNR